MAGLTPDALESASFEGALSFSSQGEKNTIKTSGAFELGSAKEMPQVDVQLSVDVPGFDGRAGFVTTGERAWFTRGDTGYAVPQKAWTKIVTARESGAAPRQTRRRSTSTRAPGFATSSPRAPRRWTASR